MCTWNRCPRDQKSLIDFNYFWSKVCYDECGFHPVKKSLCDQIQQMYFTKNFVVRAGENKYMLTIGIDPVEKFEILVRLEHDGSGVYVDMNTMELQQLFTLLKRESRADIIYPTSDAVKNITASTITLTSYQYNTYKLCVKGGKILLSWDGISKLLEIENYIRTILKNYEIRAVACANTVFKFLKLCCERLHGKNENRKFNYFNEKFVKNAMMLKINVSAMVEDINLSSIFEELLCAPCDCLSTSIIVETKIHFENLMKRWIAAYYETRLLSESIRAETFKSKWPQNGIDPKSLAKTGFFYIGPLDRVQCVFCKLTFEKWESNDTAAGEHKFFSPKCPLMQGECVHNIPLIPYSGLENILSEERKLKSESSDQIDSSRLKKLNFLSSCM